MAKPLSEQFLAQDGRYQHAVRPAAGVRVNTTGGIYAFGAPRRSPLAFWATAIALGALAACALIWGAGA